MNLSEHSESIHHSIQILKEGFKKLQKDDWLNRLFKNWNLPSWALIKMSLLGFVVVVIVFMPLPCLLNCMLRVFQNSLPKVFAMEKKGADVVIEPTEIGDINLRPWETGHCKDAH